MTSATDIIEELANKPTCEYEVERENKHGRMKTEECGAIVTSIGLLGTEYEPMRRRTIDPDGSEEIIVIDDRTPVCTAHLEAYYADLGDEDEG